MYEEEVLGFSILKESDLAAIHKETFTGFGGNGINYLFKVG